VKKALSLDAPWVDELFRRCIGDLVTKFVLDVSFVRMNSFSPAQVFELEFSEFITFLETGKPV